MARSLRLSLNFIVILALGMVPAGAQSLGDPTSPGLQRWVARYNGPGSVTDIAAHVAVSQDGARVFVTGQSDEAIGDPNFRTISYDAANGLQVWTASYAGPGGGYDYPSGLVVSSDRTRIFVTGLSRGVGTDDDFATVAYDAFSGTQLWVARYDGPAHSTDVPKGIVASPDGSRVIVTGYSTGVGTESDIVTVTYDASTGLKRWEARYTSPGNSIDYAADICMSPDGARVFVTGYSDGVGASYDYVTLAYSLTTGAGLWQRRYDGLAGQSDSAYRVRVGPDGTGVYVTGLSSLGEGSDLATLKYDARNGALLWEAHYLEFDGSANVSDLEVSPDGNRVYLSGWGEGLDTEADFATVAYDAGLGTELWEAFYDGPAHTWDYPYDLSVGLDGSDVYVVGITDGLGADYTIIAYEAETGLEHWTARYDGPSHSYDFATSVALSPNGARVYVTGGSVGPETYHDFGTVAYCTDPLGSPVGCMLG